MKVSLKLLTAFILINAINLNSPYCMEYKNESQMEVKDETELQKIDLSFEEIYTNFEKVRKMEQYHYAEYHKREFCAKQDNIAKEFCNILFDEKNEHRNLKTILHSNYECSDLDSILNIFENDEVINHFKKLLMKDDFFIEYYTKDS